VTAFGK